MMLTSCKKDEQLIGDSYIMLNNQRVNDTIYCDELGTSMVFNVDESELRGNTDYSHFEWRTFWYDEATEAYKGETNVTYYDSGTDKGFEIGFTKRGKYKVQCVMDYSNDVYAKKISKHVYVIVR